MDVLKVPLVEPSEVANGVSVWEWSGSALDEGDEASKWFSNYLGKPSRLVRFNEGILLSGHIDGFVTSAYKFPFVIHQNYRVVCNFMVLRLPLNCF